LAAPRLDGNFSSAPNRIWDDSDWMPGNHRWVLSHFYRLTCGFQRPAVRIGVRAIARRTGLDPKTIRKILPDFERWGLIKRSERWNGPVRLSDEYELLLEAPVRSQGHVDDFEPGEGECVGGVEIFMHEGKEVVHTTGGGGGNKGPGGVGKEGPGGGGKTAAIEIHSSENTTLFENVPGAKARPKKPSTKKPAPDGFDEVMKVFHSGLTELANGSKVYLNGRDGAAAKKLLSVIPKEQVLDGAALLLKAIKSGHRYYNSRGFRTYVLEAHWNEIMQMKPKQGKDEKPSQWRKEQEESNWGAKQK